MGDRHAYYSEAFSVMPGRCFRLLTRTRAHGQPEHCPAPVLWRGVFTDRTGRRGRWTPATATQGTWTDYGPASDSVPRRPELGLMTGRLDVNEVHVGTSRGGIVR
jgi:hypothetical protein